jgi:hypothetical protein
MREEERARMSDPKIKELLDKWRWDARTAQVAHLRETATLAWRDFVLGGLTAFLAGIVGVGVFASLQGSQAPLGIRIVAVVMTLITAGLVALRTRLDYGSRVESHRKASRHYTALVRECDQRRQAPNLLAEKDMTEIREKFDVADWEAADVSPWIWAWAVDCVRFERKQVEAGHEPPDAVTIGRGFWSRLKQLVRGAKPAGVSKPN